MKKYCLVLISLVILSILSREGKGILKEEIKEEITNQPVKLLEKSVVVKAKKWGNAPNFKLLTLNKEVLTLSNFAGKVIILNFWATWCGPCKDEILDFVELYNKYKDKGLTIIGVNLNQTNEDEVKQVIERMKVSYPVVIANARVIKDYGGIRGIPATFVINQKGDLVKKFIGYRSKEVFENEVKRLIKER
ncbi:TlpA family protein disulfide reductase [bacterium]|nr:TlpA family protein disulfide reductase [bacterium]MBU0899990.1 TlpA family protein disulfide reductase [bacterium]MBU1152968.1 TlpA family protein disulfide reductase [bacterium]MBU1781849.1 TlpA family protein disulfide reductase [bacterium]MBU2599676.1 TlpA family protein disulfide reductase [bacterium]